MVCYNPVICIYPSMPDIEGKRKLLFKRDEYMYSPFDSPIVYDSINRESILGYKIEVPCGKCIGCRLAYSRMWAMRSMHEAKMHDKNSFVTLTFDNDHLPDNRSVSKVYICSWLKRFRKRFGDGIRYMLCGEYGAKLGRPHYHILFYGFDFPDKYPWSYKNGVVYYRSPSLEDIWRDPFSSSGNGFSVIGEVNFESSAYVARYVTKKINGYKAKKHYDGREPEFMLTSRMPGLGNEYFYKYYQDMINVGYVVLRNRNNYFKAPIPRYYMNLLKEFKPEIYEKIKLDRQRFMIDNLFKVNVDLTRQRLEVREELQKLKLDKLLRIFEMDTFLHNI